MKTLLCLLLCVLLLPVSVPAEESAADVLTCRELTDWAQKYIDRAIAGQPLNDPAKDHTPDGYRFIYDFATLYADTTVMGADTIVSTIVLNGSEEMGPRHVSVGSAMSVVLDAYYNENPALAGSRSTAVLYTVDQLPERAAWGQVFRDGQRVQTIQYAAHEQLAAGGEGYSDMGVIYTMLENRVSALRVYGLNSRITQQQVNDVMYAAMLAALETDYVQAPFSYDGAELAMFGEADLSFSGVDFLTLDGDSAARLLGEPLNDVWMENGDRGFIRVQTYAACELTFLYDESRTQGEIYMLAISMDGMEGPRGVRVGDSFNSVYHRFRFGSGELLENSREDLYTGENGAFGMVHYGEYDASAVMRYGFEAADGRKVVLQMDFDVMELTEIMLYVD